MEKDGVGLVWEGGNPLLKTKGMKMKTMAELEMESPAEFRNPVRTLEQEAMLEKMHAERKAHEALYMAIETDVPEDEESEDE